MRSFNRNDRSGGGRRPGGPLARRGRGDFRRSSGPREMHKAVCDNCGNNCEVPFRPSGDKPIYCSDCFEQMGGGSSNRPSRRGSSGSDFEKRDNTNRQLLEQVNSLNAKLDRILKVIESGVEKKPVAEKSEVKEVEKVTKVIKKATPKDKIENPENSRRKIKTLKASKKETEKSTPKD